MIILNSHDVRLGWWKDRPIYHYHRDHPGNHEFWYLVYGKVRAYAMADPDERVNIVNRIIVAVEGWTGRFVDSYYDYELEEEQWFLVDPTTAKAEVTEYLHTLLGRVLWSNCRKWGPPPRGDRNTEPSSDQDITPSMHDVLCGNPRHETTTMKQHPGNQALRALIRDRADDYANAEGPSEKSRVIDEVIKEVEESGGRFLIQDTKTRWRIIRRKDVPCKIIQEFRQAIAKTNKG